MPSACFALPLLRLLSVACSIVVAVAAQGRATIGTFLDAEGRPVVGAEVTFATSDPLVYDAFTAPTLVTTKTDDQGRFRAELEAGRAYSVWACQGHDVAQPARSAVHEGVVAGDVLQLAVVDRSPLPRVKIAVDGFGEQLADALDGGRLRMRLRTDARHGPTWTLPIEADGTVEVPPLPAGPHAWGVVDSDGRLVADGSGWFGDRLSVMPRSQVAVTVRDEQGEPVAGAVVETLVVNFVGHQQEPFGGLRALPSWLRAAPTDASGRTTLTTAGPLGFVVAFAEGKAARAAGWTAGTRIVDGQLQPTPIGGKPPTELELTVRAVQPLRGRVHRGDTPVAGVGVEVRGDIVVSGAGTLRGSSSSTSFARRLRTSDDGSFVCADVPRPAGSIELAFAGRAREDGVPVLVRARREVPAEPLDIDLARWPVVTLQALDDVGGPPGDTRVVLWGEASADPVVLVADRAGRVRVQPEPGEWAVFVSDGEAARFAMFDAKPDGEGATIELRLQPLASCTGVLLDDDERPVAGALFNLNGASWQPRDGSETAEQLWLRKLSFEIDRRLTHGVRTDAEGRFTLRFVEIEGATLSGNFQGSPESVQLEAGAEYKLTLAR